MTLSFAMVCEAEADFRTASGFADRVFCEQVDWITEELLGDYRRWCGLDDAQPFLEWKRAAKLAREAGFRVYGNFDGERKPDAAAARRVLLLIRRMTNQPNGVLLIRDDDRQTSRRDGLKQGCVKTALSCPIVIGLAHLKRECWVLNGFEPSNPNEHKRLSELKRVLSFDPLTDAHQLTAKGDHDDRSAKRVLRVLTNGNREREEDCWRKIPLALLRTRGQATGLAEYLDELSGRLVPLFTGQAKSE